MYDQPAETVTIVENHDLARDDPIIHDKMLAYAFILTHEGYPCVFWWDYFNYNLAQEDTRSGIAALVQVHEKNAGSATSSLYVDDDLYVMQRDGYDAQRGLVFVLNNRGAWNGAWVQTKWTNTRFSPEAWHGNDDAGLPEDKWTDGSGWTEFWAPPRGYAVYVPQKQIFKMHLISVLPLVGSRIIISNILSNDLLRYKRPMNLIRMEQSN